MMGSVRGVGPHLNWARLGAHWIPLDEKLERYIYPSSLRCVCNYSSPSSSSQENHSENPSHPPCTAAIT
uniref:Uncharacterized protein n=1 Tax=Cucumis melo TaxID=3656 RepID=A0A9I9EDJ6_CUCME